MRYVSLFSGIGGFEVGIHRVFPDAECVGYSEVDAHALRVYTTHFPTHPALGDVRRVDGTALEGGVDLIVGGSPCQNLSSFMGAGQHAGDKRGLEGANSSLFFEYVRVMRECGAKHFVLENVGSMSKANRDAITQHLRAAYGKGEVYCTLLDSKHVSAQRRRRYFWTSFPVAPLEGDGPRFMDVLDTVEQVAHGCDIGERTKRRMGEVVPQWGRTRWQWGTCYSDTAHAKARTVTRQTSATSGCMVVDRRFDDDLAPYGGEGTGRMRRPTPTELERLQCFEDGWTDMLPKTHRFKVLGNAVTCGVVAHVAECLRVHFSL